MTGAETISCLVRFAKRQSNSGFEPIGGYRAARAVVVYLHHALGESVLAGLGEGDVSKDQRRLYICPHCDGTQVIVKWKRAELTDNPENHDLPTTELCPMCDGSGHVLGPSD